MTFHESAHEHEPEFLDMVYEWMESAPWVAISAAAHAILFLILVSIPWSLLDEKEEVLITATIETKTPDKFVPPPEEIIPPVEPPESPEDTEELIITDFPLPNPTPSEPNPEPNPFPDDPANNNLFEHMGEGPVIGIGGPTGNKGGRFGPPGGGGPGGFRGETDKALKWLAAHQAPDGSWDCDGFSDHCGSIGAGACDGVGESTHDVGVTGLALLAFLGAGNTTRQGLYREKVALGIHWLENNQDPDSGLIGDRVGHAYLYNHAIAALALCEAYYFSKTPIHKRSAQNAIHYISRARNPYGAWRYDAPPIGDNDTSISGWMVFALKSAEDAGLVVDPQAFTGALSWFDEVTDPATGRTGYNSIGSPSSRVPGMNDHFTTEGTESMTAVSLLSRIFMGEDPKRSELLSKQADLLRRALPDEELRDMYYWYYGTYAMFQVGGKHWKAWSRSMKPAIVETQRHDGDFAGSWDPNGVWGYSGGRVYSTAMMALCLQVHYRYARVAGAR